MDYNKAQVWIVGSRMYNLHTPDSDYDYVGVEVNENIADPTTDQAYTHVEGQSVKHSMVKFAQLLIKGNPNVLDLVFHAPMQEQPLVKGLIAAVQPYSITQATIRQYKGYLNNQQERGFQQQREHGHRETELGYDPKYIMHCMRLAFTLQGIAQTGTYHYLTPEQATYLRTVREGTLPLEEMLPIASALVRDVEAIDPERFPDVAPLKKTVQSYFKGAFLKGEE